MTLVVVKRAHLLHNFWKRRPQLAIPRVIPLKGDKVINLAAEDVGGRSQGLHAPFNRHGAHGCSAYTRSSSSSAPPSAPRKRRFQAGTSALTTTALGANVRPAETRVWSGREEGVGRVQAAEHSVAAHRSPTRRASPE